MKCMKCGAPVSGPSTHSVTAEIKGESVQIEVPARKCTGCQRLILDFKGRRAYGRAASDAYRRAHSLLTVAELDALRRQLHMTWPRFASHAGVGIATLKRWIAGEVQSASLDQLVRLRADVVFATLSLQMLKEQMSGSMSAPVEVRQIATRPRRVTFSHNEVDESLNQNETDYALVA